MLSSQLKKYLQDNGVYYGVVSHKPAYTAQRTAAVAHVHGREFAKTIVVKIDGICALAVLPSNEYVDLDALAFAFQAKKVELASEEDFVRLFPECEPGAMPPFGNLYGMKTYVSKDLTDKESIAFNAGSHTELIQIRFEDYKQLVDPMILEFATTV